MKRWKFGFLLSLLSITNIFYLPNIVARRVETVETTPYKKFYPLYLHSRKIHLIGLFDFITISQCIYSRMFSAFHESVSSICIAHSYYVIDYGLITHYSVLG